jgi:hypothetical protein
MYRHTMMPMMFRFDFFGNGERREENVSGRSHVGKCQSAAVPVPAVCEASGNAMGLSKDDAVVAEIRKSFESKCKEPLKEDAATYFARFREQFRNRRKKKKIPRSFVLRRQI